MARVIFCSDYLGKYLSQEKGLAGGAEKQQKLIMDYLQKEGIEITLLTGQYNIKAEYPIFKFDTSKNILQRMWNKIRVILKSKGEIFYYRDFSMGHLFDFPLCKILGKKVIYAISSDILCDPKKYKKRFISRILYIITVKSADIIISQTQEQKDLLLKNLKKDSIVIRNVFEIKEKKPKKQGRHIIWISTLHEWKGPEFFLKLAEEFPEEHFQLIGGPAPEDKNRSYFDAIKNKTKKIQNLEFIGFVPPDKIKDYLNQAKILVNTTPIGPHGYAIEGFPNTFLEAWYYSVPVISLVVDPDGVIEKNKLGFCSGSFKQMKEDLRELLDNKELYSKMSQNSLDYIKDNHDIKKIIKKYLQVIKCMQK
jgi:glycosyltransferase involved in cell wall biosynthesis